MHDVVILSGTRSAIGDFGGSLKDVAPWELGRIVIAEAIMRAGIEAVDVDHVVLGQVIQSEPRDAYVSRISAIAARVPDKVPALTLNRLCGSNVDAIISAAKMVALGECDVAVAGGVESMSQSPYVTKSMSWGRRMGDEGAVSLTATCLQLADFRKISETSGGKRLPLSQGSRASFFLSLTVGEVALVL